MRYFDDLMERMLKRVPDYLDKREGSIIYDALAPAALELEALWIEADHMFKNAFADTADFTHLKKLGLERGIVPFYASYAVIKGEFSAEVKKGRIFYFNNYKFVAINDSVLDDNGLFYTFLQAETKGTVCNFSSGDLKPGVGFFKVARIVKLSIPARDDETVEEFRERYFKEVRRKNFGGNIEDYERWCMEIDGVGEVKVFPVWKGGGTVKVVIVGSDFLSPSSELVDKVQTSLDPVTNHGEGVGTAPIGHTVTVVGVTALKVNVKAKLVYASGFDKEKTDAKFKEIIDKFISDERKFWGKRPLVLRVSNLVSRIVEASDYFVDVEYISINDKTSRLQLDDEVVPVLGDVVYVENPPKVCTPC